MVPYAPSCRRRPSTTRRDVAPVDDAAAVHNILAMDFTRRRIVVGLEDYEVVS